MSRKTVQKNIAYDDQRCLYYVTLRDTSCSNARPRRCRTFRSYSEALSALYANTVENLPRAPRPGARPLPRRGCTFGEWLVWWLAEDVAVNRAVATAYGYRNMVRCHILPALGAIPLRRLTPLRLQSYLYAKRSELAANTVLKHYTLMFTALHRAVQLDLLTANPMEKVIAPKKSATAYTFYSPQQLRALFAAVENTPLELVVKLAAYLGLRRSEISGLRWGAVDLRRGEIFIREARTQIGSEDVIKRPKTSSSVRKLGISGSKDLMAVLRRAYDARRSDGPSEYVVLGSDGQPPHPDQLTLWLAQVIRRCNLPKVTLHGLRHSFASVANSQGVPMFDISRALGHSSIAVTSGIYTHLFDEAETKVLRTVAKAIEK